MKLVGKVFKDTEVRLDHQYFENCLFENCLMIYAGEGPVSMTSCKFTDVSWVLVGAAGNTLKFLTAMYHGSGQGGRQLIEQLFDTIKRSEAVRPQPSSILPRAAAEDVVQA